MAKNQSTNPVRPYREVNGLECPVVIGFLITTGMAASGSLFYAQSALSFVVAVAGLGLAAVAITEKQIELNSFALGGFVLLFAQLFSIVGSFLIPTSYCQYAVVAYGLLCVVGMFQLFRLERGKMKEEQILQRNLLLRLTQQQELLVAHLTTKHKGLQTKTFRKELDRLLHKLAEIRWSVGKSNTVDDYRLTDKRLTIFIDEEFRG